MELPEVIKVNGWTLAEVKSRHKEIADALKDPIVRQKSPEVIKMLQQSERYLKAILNVFDLIQLGKEYIKESVDELNDDMAGPHG